MCCKSSGFLQSVWSAPFVSMSYRPTNLPSGNKPRIVGIPGGPTDSTKNASNRKGPRIVPTEQTHLRLDEAGHNPTPTPLFVYLLTGLSALGGFLFGYDTGVISGAMILLRETFPLSSVWQELIVGVTIAAAAVFALVGGFFNDRTGRKPVILLASLVFTAGALCMALASNRSLLLLGRIIVGAGIGKN